MVTFFFIVTNLLYAVMIMLHFDEFTALFVYNGFLLSATFPVAFETKPRSESVFSDNGKVTCSISSTELRHTKRC